MPQDEIHSSGAVTGPSSNVGKENQQPNTSVGLASSSTGDGKRADNKVRRKQQPDRQSHRASLSQHEKQRVDRIRSTATSEAKMEELRDNNIEFHDFQDDADRERIEAHTAFELEEMWDKQRENAESYRAAVLKKEGRPL